MHKPGPIDVAVLRDKADGRFFTARAAMHAAPYPPERYLVNPQPYSRRISNSRS